MRKLGKTEKAWLKKAQHDGSVCVKSGTFRPRFGWKLYPACDGVRAFRAVLSLIERGLLIQTGKISDGYRSGTDGHWNTRALRAHITEDGMAVELS
jgi:hypothetical protein